MLRSSIPLGRIFGVDVRVHLSFPLLLLLALMYSTLTTSTSWRGLVLWLALCLAVISREAARSIAALYSGLRVRAMFLLPVGGVMALAPAAGHQDPEHWNTRLVTASGPLVNFVIGLVLLGSAYAIDPHVALLAPPWISAHHVLRSFIWTQFLLGAVGLLPASTLNSHRLSPRLRKAPVDPSPAAAAPDPKPSSGFTMPAINAGSVLALAMIIGGLVLQTHVWLVLLGFFLLLYSQITVAQPVASPAAELILVQDVMLTEYTLLSTTDTLSSALDRTTHSLQDVFPVVRGNYLVGSVARATLTSRLMLEGDGYLQGIMSRSLQCAGPEEKLVDALRRSATLGASEFIPVVQDGAMLGILTPQSISRAVQQTAMLRSQRNLEDSDHR